MLKKEARKKYREMRQKLTESERDRFDDLLLINFQSAQLPFVDTLLSFWPIEENNEPNTHLFTEFLKFRNPELRTCYPVSNFEDLTMTAVEKAMVCAIQSLLFLIAIMENLSE